MNKNKREEQRELVRQRQQAALQQILVQADGKPAREIVAHLKTHLGVSRATAYRMVKTLRTCGAVSAATRPVGRPKGARVLDSQREQIIRDTILAFYRRPVRARFSELVREISQHCEKESLPAPNWRTIRARVRDLDEGSRIDAQRD